jgi:hypothetical protein
MCGSRMGTLWLVLKGLAASGEIRRLMKGRPNFHVYFSKSPLAASMWDFGEDELADRALAIPMLIYTAYKPLPPTARILGRSYVPCDA